MFITADQLLLHAIGDYVLQSDWMAANKIVKGRTGIAAITAHALTYTLPFLFLTQSPWALGFIFLTHWFIDHYKLARYLVWAKNFMAPKWIKDYVEVLPFNRREHVIMRRNYPWVECQGTGYHQDRPQWMTVWLFIAADNCMHIICNGAAILYG